jgi:hypothetical protein
LGRPILGSRKQPAHNNRLCQPGKWSFVTQETNWKELAHEFASGYPNKISHTLHLLRLDHLSRIPTVLATLLIGKKLWQGWVVAAVHSAIVCVVRTAQFGFVPANLLCIVRYAGNRSNWRQKSSHDSSAASASESQVVF